MRCRTPRGQRGRHVRTDWQRKPGTTRGSPRRSRTAKASRISRPAVKSRCAGEWGGWGRLSNDGPGQHNPDPSEGPWGGGRPTVSVASENGSEELRIAPVCRARSLEQARERRPERPSVQAALLELLAAAAGAGIVAPNILERVNKRQRRVGIGQM